MKTMPNSPQWNGIKAKVKETTSRVLSKKKTRTLWATQFCMDGKLKHT